MNEERNAEIIRRRKAGEQPTLIAHRMGLTKSTVIGVCDRHGIRTTQKNPTYNEALRSCVLSTANREGVPKAAKQWGVSIMTVYRWARLADQS